MPQHKSTAKRVKTSKKENRKNVGYKSLLKTSIKKVKNETNKESVIERLQKTNALLDKLASKSIIHKNKAANQKSKLAKYANSLSK